MKVIFICPLCTRTYRDRETFLLHMAVKKEALIAAMANPDAHAKNVPGDDK